MTGYPPEPTQVATVNGTANGPFLMVADGDSAEVNLYGLLDVLVSLD